MRKLKIVLPLMVFFALAIFVSSCSDDFTEEDALLLQGDLLEQKLRSESELATALATLQNQLAIALLDKQAQLDSLKAVQASQLAQMSAEAKAEYDAALAVLQGEIAALAAAQQAAIDSLKAVYQADLSAQARDHEAEIAAMLAEMKAAIDSLLAAQKGQIDAEKALLLDSLARIGGIVNYSVNVVPAGNASFGQGATNIYSKTDVAGIRVIASQNGVTYETVTDAGGIANFPNMRVGNVAVTVLGSAVDHTDLRFVANLNTTGTGNGVDYSKITRNAGTRVALFPVGASPLAATLNGQITWEQNLTNDEREVAPVGLPILARLNANDATFRARYFNTSVNGMSGIQLGGSVVSMAYDPAVSRGAVTGTDGTYTITGAPASLDGLELELVVNDFAADQTLLLDRLNVRDFPRTPAAAAATGKVANVRTFFSTSGATPTTVPTVASAFVMVPAPTNVFVPGTNPGSSTGGAAIGSGAAATGVVGPLSGGIQAISVTNTGSGYSVAPTVSLPAPEVIGGVQATAVATINAAGNVTNITVTNPGSGYEDDNYGVTITPANVNATAVASVTYSVTGATAGVDFDATDASPNAFGNAGVYTLASDAPTVTVAGGNGGAPAATIAAKMTTAVYGATVTAGGADYTSVPQVSISQPGGSGTGAQGTAILRYRVASVDVASTTGPTASTTGFYSAAPTVTFGGGGTPNATGTAVLGATGTVYENPNGTLDDVHFTPGVYLTRQNVINNAIGAGVETEDSVVYSGLGAFADGAQFDADARYLGWIVDNGGNDDLEVTVTFRMNDFGPQNGIARTGDTTTFQADAQLTIVGITVTDGGTGYDAATPPTLDINIGAILVAAEDRYRTTATLQTDLIVARTIESITVLTGGSYTNAGDPTLVVTNNVANNALLIDAALETDADFDITTTGFISEVIISQIGSGYDPADLPTITFLGGGGTGAAATLVLAQGVAGYEVVDGSFGYTQDAVVTITDGTLLPLTGTTLPAFTPRAAPNLTYGNGRVTSAQILNPGSGIMAPNGTLRGTIQGAAGQVGGNAGNAEFTFGVTGGQLSSVTIDKAGSWTNPGFPLAVTNFVIDVDAHDGGPIAVGNATNNNANIRAALAEAGAVAPIVGIVGVNVSNGGSGYTSNPSVSFANSAFTFAPLVVGDDPTRRNASGTAVVVAGVVQGVNVTNSGVYGANNATVNPVLVTFTSATTPVVPGAPATAGTIVGQQAYVSLTIDASTGRVMGATLDDGGSGYTAIPELTVYSSIPGVGEGAEVVITTRTPIATGVTPSGGTFTGIRVNNGGSGYFGRNFPAAKPAQFFGTNNTPLVNVVSGGTHAKDIYLGTGVRTIID